MHLYYSDLTESGKSPAWLRGAISSGLGSLMILQAAKRIAGIRFDISGNMFLIYHTDMTERM